MAFTYQGYYLLHLAPQLNLVIVLSGVATMFVYLLIRVVATKRINEYAPEDRWDFFKRNLHVMQVLTLVSLIACIILYLLVPRNIQLVLLIPGIISVLYGIPIRFKKGVFRLRDIGISKIFMISFVWGFIGSFLPGSVSGLDVYSEAIYILFIANFLFTFAITIPFDIKDLQIDAQHHVKTIPAIIGKQKSYILAFTALILSGIFHIYLQNSYLQEVSYSIPIALSILISAGCIYLTKVKTDNLMFFGILDGMLILQAVLIVCWDTISG